MPKCTNIPHGCTPVYYNGKEKSPLGIGLSPRYESVGTIHKGNDGRMYIIGYSGINLKRWIHIWWV